MCTQLLECRRLFVDVSSVESQVSSVRIGSDMSSLLGVLVSGKSGGKRYYPRMTHFSTIFTLMLLFE